jgi:hypothetical protein
MTDTTRPVDAESSETRLADVCAAPVGPKHRFEVGALVAGRYRIDSFLGDGGMGEVYGAHDTLLKQRFALKSLAPAVLHDTHAMQRFLREVTVAIRVSHPNVCRVHNYIGDGCFLMELVDGHTLSDITGLPWSVDRALPVLEEVARGLDAIHAENIAHRDLKPANIMLGPSGGAKIMDFGLARATDSFDDRITRMGGWVGTLPFMAPEQLDGDEPTAAVDVWAFGVIAYWLVTGVHPYRKATRVETERAIKDPVQPPREHNALLPSRWDAAILRCLRQNSAERFRRASDFLAAVTQPSTVGSVAVAPPLQLPDLWTPGTPRPPFVDAYARVVGTVRAQELWVIAEQGIRAVEDGDFARQVTLGRHVEKTFGDVAEVAAAGTYFLAEGLRLCGSLESDAAQRSQLLAQAESEYSAAVLRLPADPRPLRGLGRVLELQGELGAAEQLLHRAKALSMLTDDVPTAVAAAHERLRTTRHYVHCVLDIRADSPTSVWNSERKAEQLRGYIVECANLHEEIMPRYQSRPQWSMIEWFMGLVFLAKAWASVGDVMHATFTLLHALRVRLELMPAAGALTDVERSNVQWWLSVATTVALPGDRIIRSAAEGIAAALAMNDRGALKVVASPIIFSFSPPWTSNLRHPSAPGTLVSE